VNTNSGKGKSLIFLSVCSLMACDLNGLGVYGENVLQKKRVYAIEDELNNRIKSTKKLVPFKIGSLQNYQHACVVNVPKIEHENCLSIAVEGQNFQATQFHIEALIHSLRMTPLSESTNKLLNGSTLVLIPAVRDSQYGGLITPNAINHSFKTAKPFLFKFGE
jgi:hypothetical protein